MVRFKINFTIQQTRVTLPEDTGLAESETVKVLFVGTDDLDNDSTQIQPDNTFQVYQGGLPPLPPPSSLTGRAVSRGRIELSWNCVENAAGYQIFRQAPGEAELTLLDTVDSQIAYTDTTETDGTHVYAVATIRRENGEESISGLSSTASVESDSVAPEAPLNLVLDMVSQGIRAQWTAPA